ncbi:uncharacterized protein LOC142337274 isoform X2 [Convolutriloba macropyga]|uniref:uncharacterized protein LOC142337274 isoform X2 n=1 Tax=Convolutriloba macropyga TaxID=536237 RepID=UPI003F51BF88
MAAILLFIYLFVLSSLLAHQVVSLHCSSTTDDRSRNLLVCVEDNRNIYLWPPQHILKFQVTLSRNLIGLHQHQLSPDLCTQLKASTYMCFVTLPKTRPGQPVRIAFSLGETAAVDLYVYQERLQDISTSNKQDQFGTDDGNDDGKEHTDLFPFSDDGEKISSSRQCRQNVRFDLEACEGLCPYTVAVNFHNCSESHWQARSEAFLRQFQPRASHDDETNNNNFKNDQLGEKYRFFSDLTDNDQIIFVGVNSQLVLQCNPSDVSEHYEEAEVANLEVRLPTTSQMGKLSLYDKRLKSKDGNVELRLDSSTLIVRKMTYALYGSYVCHFTPILDSSNDRKRNSGEDEIRRYLVVPHWCDTERLNWGVECEHRCVCWDRWKLPIHYGQCDCTAYLKEMKSDMIQLQIVVLIVLTLLMVSIFLCFLCCKDPSKPDQSVFRGFVLFVSTAWLHNTVPADRQAIDGSSSLLLNDDRSMWEDEES